LLNSKKVRVHLATKLFCPNYSSCTEAMGESSLSMVRNAARLAVYEEIMIRVKNHQKLATVRVDTARGRKSQPCGVGNSDFDKNFIISM
jgi:hypothetical protein